VIEDVKKINLVSQNTVKDSANNRVSSINVNMDTPLFTSGSGQDASVKKKGEDISINFTSYQQKLKGLPYMKQVTNSSGNSGESGVPQMIPVAIDDF